MQSQIQEVGRLKQEVAKLSRDATLAKRLIKKAGGVSGTVVDLVEGPDEVPVRMPQQPDVRPGSSVYELLISQTQHNVAVPAQLARRAEHAETAANQAQAQCAMLQQITRIPVPNDGRMYNCCVS